ncbi:hypothetical protein CICLE_v10023191mg [Citrus x clementina]|uniref:Uncharacterized protein n=1 Tax=Citrus clementina TaxID=85681 RepID=V4VN03_CITCL|nr:hypothetical protein CICLE_v10023191mg [Citrus x clementina]
MATNSIKYKFAENYHSRNDDYLSSDDSLKVQPCNVCIICIYIFNNYMEECFSNSQLLLITQLSIAEKFPHYY